MAIRELVKAMNVLVVGMSHRTAEMGVLADFRRSAPDPAALLREVLSCPDVGEAVLLSTCNRVEVYATVETFHGGVTDLSGVLGTRLLYAHYSTAAVEHLFSVAAGLV